MQRLSAVTHLHVNESLLYEGALGDLNVSERSFGEVKVPVFPCMVFGTFRY